MSLIIGQLCSCNVYWTNLSRPFRTTFAFFSNFLKVITQLQLSKFLLLLFLEKSDLLFFSLTHTVHSVRERGDHHLPAPPSVVRNRHARLSFVPVSVGASRAERFSLGVKKRLHPASSSLLFPEKRHRKKNCLLEIK